MLTFKVREMPAVQAESWIIRALLLIGNKIQTPQGADLTAALGSIDTNNFMKAVSGISYEQAKPLLDELLGCCSRIDGGIEQVCEPTTIDGYVQDFRTLFKLRLEALTLMFSVFMDAAPSSSPDGQPLIGNAN